MGLFIWVVAGVATCLMLALLIYLWIPEKDPRKQKAAISRLNKIVNESQRQGISIGQGIEARERGLDRSQPPNEIAILDQPSPSTFVWKHKRVISFRDRFVDPFSKVLEGSGYLGRIDALLSILDDHGDCPSVVQLWGDKEQEEIGNVYSLLSQISLLDHSLNVAEKIVGEIMERKVKDPEMLVGKLLVTALGHDIGKIPKFITASQYSKGDHAYLSYLVLKNAILTDNFPQREEILNAVREHHYKVEKGLTGQLRKADHMAREMEAEQLAARGQPVNELIAALASVRTGPVHDSEPENQGEHGEAKKKGQAPSLLNLDWLDLHEFIQLVEPHINLEREGRFKAFSMNNGLVYLMLSLVSDTVTSLAQKHNHPSVLVGCETKEKRRAIEYTVKTMLAQKGLIPSFIGDGYSGARFALYDKSGKKLTVGLYMPVSVEAFNSSLSELEARKKSCPFIKQIARVQPKIGAQAEEKNS